jgi:hypothetical protein
VIPSGHPWPHFSSTARFVETSIGCVFDFGRALSSKSPASALQHVLTADAKAKRLKRLHGIS